ncbi:hypothetical protein SAMN05444279_11726 [Ruegeria intermedia]|uniref:Uncharacterized protein n=1 Tax=Ruegeria intermedia TaxID=996115 RepID=A0A1M4YX24_9RHOB|nr:hypothetical protein [Ruegeria intermedia]SHF10374.1 hypothetical protein SAMN05444279_11726 [Ruegeria intermedia]
MNAGYDNRAAVFWSQTEIDGLEAAPLADLTVGSVWSLLGRVTYLRDAYRVMSSQAVASASRASQSRSASQLAGLEPSSSIARVVLTNGAQSFEAELALVDGAEKPVLFFDNGCPAPGQEFWVSEMNAVTQTGANGTSRANVLVFPSQVAEVSGRVPAN